MARVAVVITKKEFEQARKDRRTRLVDIVALLVGLMLLSGGVGAVWAIEPVIPPQTEWSVQWNEVDHGGKACKAPPKPGMIKCELGQILDGEHKEYIKEGETNTVTWKIPETTVNITEVDVKLYWTDETVERSWVGTGRDAKPTGDEHPESWDCMRLKAFAPNGETYSAYRCGGHDQGDNGTVGGKIETTFHFADKPNVTSVKGKRAEAERQVVLPPTTGGTGEWKFEITLVKAGDVRGNQTKTACDQAGSACPMLVTYGDTNPDTEQGRINQGNCRATLFMACDGARTDAKQEYYLHVIWTTYDLRQLV